MAYRGRGGWGGSCRVEVGEKEKGKKSNSCANNYDYRVGNKKSREE